MIVILELQIQQFAQAQPGGVEQFQYRQIPNRQRIAVIDVEQLVHLVHVQGMGQLSFAFGWPHTLGRVGVGFTVLDQKIKQAADTGQKPLQGFAFTALAMTLCDQYADMVGLDLSVVLQLLLFTKLL